MFSFIGPHHPDHCFVELVCEIMTRGDTIKTRNSETKRVINPIFRFKSTPLISVRKTAWRLALREMEWFLSGSNDINDLHKSVHSWWNPWVNKDSKIAYNYGVQLRSFMG